jgi:tRNA(adenine34) deaminase
MPSSVPWIRRSARSSPYREGMTGYLASFEPAMRLAIAEAEMAAAAGEVPVGAIVLGPDGSVLGQGRNRREAAADPTAHAEVVALQAAGRARASWRLDGCTLVVTLEPCTMCAGAALVGRVSRLIFGAHDPRSGAAGSVWDVLHDPRLGPPVEVRSGVLSAECAGLLSDFFEDRR